MRETMLQIGPFIKSIPLGWYHTNFYSVSKGQDDYNEVNRLTLVFDDEKERYEELMDNFVASNLTLISRRRNKI